MQIIRMYIHWTTQHSDTIGYYGDTTQYHMLHLVCRSKCRSYIGLHGIVIQETQNTFKLICKDDKIRSEQRSLML